MNLSKYVRLIVIASIGGMFGQLLFGDIISGAAIAAGLGIGLYHDDNGRISWLLQIGLILVAALIGDLWFENIGGSGIVVGATVAVALMAIADRRTRPSAEQPDDE